MLFWVYAGIAFDVSIYLSICLSVYLSFYLSIYLSTYRTMDLWIHPCIHPSIHQPSPSMHPPSIPCIPLSLSLFVIVSRVFLCPCIYSSIYLESRCHVPSLSLSLSSYECMLGLNIHNYIFFECMEIYMLKSLNMSTYMCRIASPSFSLYFIYLISIATKANAKKFIRIEVLMVLSFHTHTNADTYENMHW